MVWVSLFCFSPLFTYFLSFFLIFYSLHHLCNCGLEISGYSLKSEWLSRDWVRNSKVGCWCRSVGIKNVVLPQSTFPISWFPHRNEGVQHSLAIVRKSCPSGLSIIVLLCAGVWASQLKKNPTTLLLSHHSGSTHFKEAWRYLRAKAYFVLLGNLFSIPGCCLICWELGCFVRLPALGCRYPGWALSVVVLPRNHLLLLLRVRELIKLVRVWRDTYPTRRDTRLGSRERDEIFRHFFFIYFFLFFSQWWKTHCIVKIVFHSAEKQKLQKNVGAFWNQLILYEMKRF